jgi:hypothetical protein
VFVGYCLNHAGDIFRMCDPDTKIYDRGNPFMLVGYCLNHAGDKFRMWDPDIKRVHLSCDIVWTGRMYFDSMQKILEENFTHPILENNNNDDINGEKNNKKKEKNNENKDDVKEKAINKVSIDNESNNQIKT